MRHFITFLTNKFDPSKEDENLANPYAGQSVLNWLRENVIPDNYNCDTPDYEDWGWYMDIYNTESKYMIGASYFWESGAPLEPDQEWSIQIVKERSILDKVFGRNKMLLDDPIFKVIINKLHQDSDIIKINHETDG